jgi:hypothetical protein
MSSFTTFKVCDYTLKLFHRPVYLRLLTSSGHLWNSVLIVLSPAIWWRSMELLCKTKEMLVKFIIDWFIHYNRSGSVYSAVRAEFLYKTDTLRL